MDPANFAYIREFLAEHAAIALDEQKDYLVNSRLLPVARQAGFPSVDALVSHLRLRSPSELQQRVVEALTTNETYFFRDEAPFRLLRTMLLPELIRRRAAVRQLNIWSAGCSSGQEIYSVAMLLREGFGPFNDWRLRLLGTDLSSSVLSRAAAGLFTDFEVKRGVPPEFLRHYFHRRGSDWQINENVRKMVEFRQVNLKQPWPALPQMDLVLLRNVMVYFDLGAKRDILARLRRVLHADGYLLLGGAETTVQIDRHYRVLRNAGCSYFQLRQEGD